MSLAPNTVPEAQPLPPPVATVADAEQLAGHYSEVMEALLAVVEQETRFVRTGKLRDAAGLETTKTDLARLYITDTLRVKASRAFLAQSVPDTMRKLVKRHDTFRAVLQMNLTVLATAHAVSEGIVRGVSEELAKKATPATYGSSGKAVDTYRTPVQPMAVSRVL